MALHGANADQLLLHPYRLLPPPTRAPQQHLGLLARGRRSSPQLQQGRGLAQQSDAEQRLQRRRVVQQRASHYGSGPWLGRHANRMALPLSIGELRTAGTVAEPEKCLAGCDAAARSIGNAGSWWVARPCDLCRCSLRAGSAMRRCTGITMSTGRPTACAARQSLGFSVPADDRPAAVGGDDGVGHRTPTSIRS